MGLHAVADSTATITSALALAVTLAGTRKRESTWPLTPHHRGLVPSPQQRSHRR